MRTPTSKPIPSRSAWAGEPAKPSPRLKGYGLPREPRAVQYIRDRLRWKLDRFKARIDGLEIRMRQETTTLGEDLVLCALCISLAQGTEVSVGRYASDPLEAFDHALGAAGRRLQRRFQSERHR